MGKGAKRKTKWVSLSLVAGAASPLSVEKIEDSTKTTTKPYRTVLTNDASSNEENININNTSNKHYTSHNNHSSSWDHENNSSYKRKPFPPHSYNNESSNRSFTQDERSTGSRRSYYQKRPFYNSHYNYNNSYNNKVVNKEKDDTETDKKQTFNDDEYTRITTPRQDVLFKKGYLSRPKKYLQPVQELLSPADDNSAAGTSTESILSDSLSPEQVYTPNSMEYNAPYFGYIDENGVLLYNPIPLDNGYGNYYPGQMCLYPYINNHQCHQDPNNPYPSYNTSYESSDKEILKEDADVIKEEDLAPELNRTETEVVNNEEECNNVYSQQPKMEVLSEEQIPDNLNYLEYADKTELNETEVPSFYPPFYYPGYLMAPVVCGVPFYDNMMMNTDNYIRQSRYRKKKRRFRANNSDGATTSTDYSGDESCDDHAQNNIVELPIKSNLNVDVQEFRPSKLIEDAENVPSSAYPINSNKNNLSENNNINNNNQVPVTEMPVDTNAVAADEIVLNNCPTSKNKASKNKAVLSKKQLIQSTKQITEQNIDLLAKNNNKVTKPNQNREWTIVRKGKFIVHPEKPAAISESVSISTDSTSTASPRSSTERIVPNAEPVQTVGKQPKRNKIKSKKAKKPKFLQVQEGFQVEEPDFSSNVVDEEELHDDETNSEVLPVETESVAESSPAASPSSSTPPPQQLELQPPTTEDVVEVFLEPEIEEELIEKIVQVPLESEDTNMPLETPIIADPELNQLEIENEVIVEEKLVPEEVTEEVAVVPVPVEGMQVTEAVTKWLSMNLELKNIDEIFKIPDDPSLLDIINKLSGTSLDDNYDSLTDSFSEGDGDEDDCCRKHELIDTDSDYMSDIQIRNSDNQNQLIFRSNNNKNSLAHADSKLAGEPHESLTDPIFEIEQNFIATNNLQTNKRCIIM